MVSDSMLHSNVFKVLFVRQADLSTVKLANCLSEPLTQANTITSNKTFRTLKAQKWSNMQKVCKSNQNQREENHNLELD